jgi:ATP-dependent RNA helicase DDX27
MLPLLERMLHRGPRPSPATHVLVLVPTRELAVQVHKMTERLAQFTSVRAALVVGGLSATVQAAALRTRPEIVVATPGRLIDHVRNTHSVGLEDLAALVLDEADRLLEMGFLEEIREIVRHCPPRRQTMFCVCARAPRRRRRRTSSRCSSARSRTESSSSRARSSRRTG